MNKKALIILVSIPALTAIAFAGNQLYTAQQNKNKQIEISRRIIQLSPVDSMGTLMANFMASVNRAQQQEAIDDFAKFAMEWMSTSGKEIKLLTDEWPASPENDDLYSACLIDVKHSYVEFMRASKNFSNSATQSGFDEFATAGGEAKAAIIVCNELLSKLQ